MILKSSDKLIAIIGVIILIIAGIGIFIYISNEDDTDNKAETHIKRYKVEWIQDSDNTDTIPNTRVERNTPYNKPIDITINEEPVSVLTSVDINLKWKDSCTGFIFKNGPIKLGKDKLSAEFSYKGKMERIAEQTGEGDKTVSFSIFDEPTEEIIEDEEFLDINDALIYVKDKYMNMNSAIIETKVNIKNGLGELLRFWRDNGENFNLELTYTYYYAVISEVEEEEPPTDLNPSGYQPPSYSMMCLPGML